MSKPTGQPTPGTKFTPPPSKVDWARVRIEFEKEAAQALIEFKQEIEQAYQEKAQAQLNTTRDRYLESLSFAIVDDGVEVSMSGWLPTAVEEGWDTFDMKPGLLAGRMSRVIRLRNGNFRTVSVNSRPGSWWSPGQQARPISAQVEGEVERISERTIDPVIEKFLARVEM